MNINKVTEEYIKATVELYEKETLSLHEPFFFGNEKSYVNRAVDSGFVSYHGHFVEVFEKAFAKYTGAKNAIAVVNGTSALHAALLTVGVKPGDEVITQPLTFVATANAISYCGAEPVFIDVNPSTLGLCPKKLKIFLTQNTEIKKGHTYSLITGKKISCVLPMHTFGIPAQIREICKISRQFKIPVVEDAAEALGSFSGSTHAGRFGDVGIFSFNANKIITSGGGGMMITDNHKHFDHASHITKTSKQPHDYEFYHDQIGYNYRMSNLNAAIGLAQLEKINDVLKVKSYLFNYWKKFFNQFNVKVFECKNSDTWNNWLIAVQFNSKSDRDTFLKITNENKIGTRPIWKLMNKLPMYKNSYYANLDCCENLESLIVNIPSGLPNKFGLPKLTTN